ncbi:MAG: hypothetical protein ISS82_03295 [Nanoarchaeota archaeon]|nr:hypothetical protein [Nanoarchaeota archaeon]
MQTEQFNIRLPTDLVSDLEVISKLLKVNKSEWVKLKLAEDVMEEKNRLLMELSNLYVKGLIDKKGIQFLVGKKTAEQMEFIKKTAVESARMGSEHGKKVRKKLKR